MDELAIRTIAERFEALTELDKRRNAILESISGQGLLTDELRKAILACATKTQLETCTCLIVQSVALGQLLRGSVALSRWRG